MPELGGWLSALMTVAGVALLGGTIAFGTLQWSKRPRDAATRRASDEAARRNFDKEPHTRPR